MLPLQRLQKPPHGKQRLAALGVLALAAALAACGGEQPKSGSSGSGTGTPVILISIDTLRSDRLPAYGYDAIETPAIDALRADAVLFENAFTHINQTLPSHASIFTGQLPPEHGVRDNIGYQLQDEARTLAEVLGEAGYDTAGFVSSFVLRAGTGVEQGFDIWDDHIEMDSRQGLGGLQRDGMATLLPANRWLEQHSTSGAGAPFFLFFHIYDPHAPYEPAEPFRSRYANAYDAEVAESDAIIGGLLEQLRQLDLYDDSLIVLLSDHGEGLMDHGEMDHLVFAYREVLQIPLLLKLPGSRFAGQTVTAPAQTSDIFWTVLELLGLDAGTTMGEGVAAPMVLLEERAERLAERPDQQQRYVFSESMYPKIHLGWSDLASMIRWPHHLIDGPDPELYDLVEDPAQRDNLLRQRRREYRDLKASLDSIDRTLQSADEIDAQTAARLASLGYVSGAGSRGDGPLPDPKDRIHLLEKLGRGTKAFDAQRYDEAVALFTEVSQAEPRMVLAHQQLGRTLRAAGRPREALDPFKKALELSGGSPSIALSLGEIYLQLGEPEAAREHALLAEGEHDQADHLLARIALREDDLEAATSYMSKALAARGDRVAPLVTQVALLVKRQRYQDALAMAEEALRAFGQRADTSVLAGLHLQRGNAYSNLGRGEEAEAAFRREIEVSPETLSAYSNLAFLLVLEGRGNESIEVLQGMVERLDSPAAHLQAARTIAAFGDRRSAEALLASARRRWPNDRTLSGADLSQIEPPSFATD